MNAHPESAPTQTGIPESSSQSQGQSREPSSEQSLEALAWVQAGRVAAIERFPYLDTALSAMVPVAAPGLGTVATDRRWRFYYDPWRTLNQTRAGKIDAVISDWVHEVGHQLRDHSARWKDLSQPDGQHRTFNVAGDALINKDLLELGLELLDTDVTFAALPGDVHAAMTTEDVYFGLLKEQDTTDSPDCGSGASGPDRPWEVSDDSGGVDGSVPPARGVTIQEDTAAKVREHVRGWGHESVPGGLRTWSQELLEPLVDWRRELRAVVSRSMGQAAGRRDYSWSRSARRRIPGYLLPGMVEPAPPQAAAVVDTSASMSVADLTQCLSDIAALTRSAGGIGVQVLPCDMSVGPVSVVRNRGDVPTISLTGGGGTDMSIGVEAAASLRPKPNLIITLTDGYTNWPTEPPSAAPRTKYLVVMIGDPPEEVSDAVPEWMHVVHAPNLGVGA